LRKVIHPASGTIAASIVFAVKSEGATTLHDVVFRRTMLGYARDFGREGIAATCAILQQQCGWSPQQVEAETAEYEQFAAASKAATGSS
jgi:glycerol-3-phosphate dehydrogenase